MGTPGWNVCSWTGDWYYLGVYATSHSLDEIRANPNNTDFTSVTVGARDAVTYREVTDVGRELCDVAFSGQDGTVLIRIAKKGSERAVEDPCSKGMHRTARLA